MDYTALRDAVLKLKERIIKTEAGDTQLSETDTRQGLINPLFRALQWDFTDFDSIRSGTPRAPIQRASRLRLLQLEEKVLQAHPALGGQATREHHRPQEPRQAAHLLPRRDRGPMGSAV